jgi:hypothetical protein
MSESNDNNSPAGHPNQFNQRRANRRLFWGRFALGVVTVGGIIALHWVAISLEAVLKNEKVWKAIGDWLHTSEDFGLLLVALTAFGLLTWVLYALRKFIVGAHVRSFQLADRERRPCVVSLVSSEDFRTGNGRLAEMRDATGQITGWTLDGKPYLEATDLGGLSRLERLRLAEQRADDTKAVPPWNWQQLIRGLIPHEEKLRQVWLVGSPGDKGSFKLLPKCRRFLMALLGPDVQVLIEGKDIVSATLTDAEAERCSGQAVNFEDFEKLTTRLESLLHRIASAPYKQAESAVVVDVTGGQKTTSIAGAAITLKSDAVFQYVQTGAENRVLIYDAVWVEQPHLRE